MSIVQRVDQLDINHDAVAGPTHTAFQHVRYPEDFANFAQVAHGSTGKLHYRGTADDAQPADLRQTGKNVILDAVGEKRVFLIGAKVRERQNGNTLFRNRFAAFATEREPLI